MLCVVEFIRLDELPKNAASTSFRCSKHKHRDDYTEIYSKMTCCGDGMSIGFIRSEIECLTDAASASLRCCKTKHYMITLKCDRNRRVAKMVCQLKSFGWIWNVQSTLLTLLSGVVNANTASLHEKCN